MNRINSTIAATVVALVSLTGIVLAQEGEYYEGTERTPSMEVNGSRELSYGYTGSINNPALRNGWDTTPKAINRGDYYGGATRPN